MALRYTWIALAWMLVSSLAAADELIMKNGTKLVGTLVSASEDSVVFDTPFAGEITIKEENIDEIITSTPVTILMDDGTVFVDKEIITEDDKVFVLREDTQPTVLNIDEIDLITPEPWRLGEGYKWTGQVNALLVSERGNTDTDELDGDFETIWRSLEDRITIRGLIEQDKNDGDKTKDTWWLRNKYDRFFVKDPDNYWGYQVYFEYDKFADLDLRTLTGPYIGRQFFENDILNMHAEIGVVYVDEQFDVAEDRDFWGSSWEVRLTSGIIPMLELYVDQSGVLNLNETADTIVNTVAGVRFPTIYGLQTSAEAKWEYDGGAVDGVDDTDETYTIKVGYAW